MPDKKTVSLWKEHIQEEIDAAFLYRVLAELESDEKKRSIYEQLAVVEDRHTAIWRDMLEKHDVHVGKETPSGKARFLSWLAHRFGTGLLSRMVLREESKEVKSYLELHKQSKDKPTRDIARELATDSAQHADKLSTLMELDEEPWHSSESGGLLRNIVYGFNDGLTANFGLIAGVIGAHTSAHMILISGISGMLADALSMGASGFLAAASEREVYEHERRMEAEEIRVMPELETEELSLMYEAKGVDKERARIMAEEIMKTPDQALDDMVHEELGISKPQMTPFKEGWITGLATAIGAVIPVLPFLFLTGTAAIATSFIIAMLAHYLVGAARSAFTGRGVIRSGFDMFIVGFGVAFVGYLIGELVLVYL